MVATIEKAALEYTCVRCLGTIPKGTDYIYNETGRREHLLQEQCSTRQRHYFICTTETEGAPLCDRCARRTRRLCKLVHEALAAGVRVGSGTIANLRRDEEKLKEYDEWKEANSARSE